MYGSIFNLKVKPGHEADLLKTLNETTSDTPEGGFAFFVMQPDQGGDWAAVAVFKDKESYVANANRPEQHEMFLSMMEHLEAEPRWNDGTYVISQVL